MWGSSGLDGDQASGPWCSSSTLATWLSSFLWAGVLSSWLLLPGGVWAASASRRPSCRSSMSLEVPVTGSAWVNFDHRCTSSSPCGQPRKLCVFGGGTYTTWA